MNLVNLERVVKSFGTTTPLAGVSLGVAQDERIGVVGVNGGGKTTLLEVLTGRESPDAGRVTRRSGLRVGFVTQALELDPAATVRAVVLPGEAFAAEHEWAGNAAVREVLTGLGLAGIGLDTPVGPLSGGERRRVALAAALVHETDLLALDEPTNHLDVEGVAWLAGHLTGRAGALLVVTHDRWFLDAVCTRTWEVGGGQVQAYDGGYAAYVLARAERARLAASSEARRQNLLRKELAWLRRGPPARTSKPRFRIDAAQALIADEPQPRDRVQLQAFATHRLGRTVYDVEDVTLQRGPRTLLADVSWHVGPGDRIAVVGVNGSGKTSLLRMLTGDLAPAAGRVVVGSTVRAAYLSQEITELPAGLRVLEAVQQIAQTIRWGRAEIGASALLERFGFAPVRQWTPVADLSGGERRRLQLLRLLMAEPNVLLLDEPTNDLDIDTLTALEDLLDSWPGTLLVVSHDRYLIERVCDTVVALLGRGVLADLPGGVEEYLTRRLVQSAAAAVPSPPSASVSSSASPSPAADARPADARPADVRAARKEMARLERRMLRLDRDEQRLLDELAEHATDYERVNVLDVELRALRAEREAVETAWLEAAESAG